MTEQGRRAGDGPAHASEPGPAASHDEAAVRDSIERFRQIAEHIDLVLWAHELQPHDHLSYVSPAFERVWGWPVHALYDNPRFWIEAILPEDRAAAAGAFDRGKQGAAFQSEYRIVRRDGALRWISDRGRPWLDADGNVYRVTGSAEDITARKLAELRARDSERQVEALIEGLPHLVWTCRPDGECDYLSRQWSEYAGESSTPDLSARSAALLHPDDAPRVLAEWRHAVQQESDYTCHYRLRRRDGVYRWFKARALPLRGDDGSLQRWFGTCTDIQNLKQAEAALRDERNRLERIARTAPSILHTYRRAPDESESFPYGSERIAALYELPPDAVRRDATTLGQRIDPASRQRLRDAIDHSALTMQPWLEQFCIRTPSRAEVWVEGHSTPVADEDGGISWHGSLTDITQRKAAEQALFDSQAQLQSLFDHLEDGLITLTPEGRMLQWNPVALRLHGFDDGELIPDVGHPRLQPFELYSLDGAFVPQADWPLARILRGETLREVEQRVRHRQNGWERVISYSGALVRGADGQAILSIMQMRDTTERRRKDDELRQLTQRLEDRVRERTAELEDANHELEAFSYSVSHDLRAPLRAMDGFSQLLLRDYPAQLGTEGQRYLDIIRESSRKMSQLIDDLLAFARLSRQALVKRPVHTAALVAEVIRQLQPMQQGRDVAWQVGELPGCDGDLPMLRQVWINLLSNALKYSRPRARAVIEIGAREHGGSAAYFVRDNGTGFDMAYAHKLFGVFERLHRDEEFEGTGVGLALVQRIVRRHGGEVHAEGQPGQGATFTFSLGGG